MTSVTFANRARFSISLRLGLDSIPSSFGVGFRITLLSIDNQFSSKLSCYRPQRVSESSILQLDITNSSGLMRARASFASPGEKGFIADDVVTAEIRPLKGLPLLPIALAIDMGNLTVLVNIGILGNFLEARNNTGISECD